MSGGPLEAWSSPCPHLPPPSSPFHHSVRDLRYLELIHNIEERRKQHGDSADRNMWLADVYAYQGKFDKAAELYRKTGQEQRAMEVGLG